MELLPEGIELLRREYPRRYELTHKDLKDITDTLNRCSEYSSECKGCHFHPECRSLDDAITESCDCAIDREGYHNPTRSYSNNDTWIPQMHLPSLIRQSL